MTAKNAITLVVTCNSHDHTCKHHCHVKYYTTHYFTRYQTELYTKHQTPSLITSTSNYTLRHESMGTE